GPTRNAVVAVLPSGSHTARASSATRFWLPPEAARRTTRCSHRKVFVLACCAKSSEATEIAADECRRPRARREGHLRLARDAAGSDDPTAAIEQGEANLVRGRLRRRQPEATRQPACGVPKFRAVR